MRHSQRAASLLGFAWICSVSQAVWAQNDPFGRSLGGGGDFRPELGDRPAAAKKKEPPADQPETHAASGAGDSVIAPGQEPTLPEHPLEMSEQTRAQIGTDSQPSRFELGKLNQPERNFYGLYYDETDNDYSFRTLFPFWLERKQPSLTDPSKVDRASLFGGLYYNRRSAEHADDVLFPFFWNLREGPERTTIVGPFVNRSAPEESDNWLAPLYFLGTRKQGGGYTVLPPLLTYSNWDQEGGFSLYGPAFCSWTQGLNCNRDTAKSLDRGIFPLYFEGYSADTDYRLVLPLLHYHSEDRKQESWLNVWGPVYRTHSPKLDKLHVFPLYYSLWNDTERHTTLLPFFHYGHDQKSSLFINPLYLTAQGEHGESTFVTWGYARYRGRTELDMITPLYWDYRDPDIGLSQQLLFPFYFRKTSPRDNDIALFPFYGHFERYGISESTWVTPLFRHSHGLGGWSTNLYPVFYTGREAHDTHFVIAPFFWDYAGRDSRSTIGFPLFWRFADHDSLTQVVGNVYYSEKRVQHGTDWEFHVFPAFSMGSTPDGHWWNVLYGLAGYQRKGSLTRVRTFWVPITISE